MLVREKIYIQDKQKEKERMLCIRANNWKFKEIQKQEIKATKLWLYELK